jgi:FMN phosphatase YigB (HAD superfamily)
MEVLPGRCVFVDDQAQYLDGATEVGIRTLHIVRDATYRPTARLGRHRVIEDLSALSPLSYTPP